MKGFGEKDQSKKTKITKKEENVNVDQLIKKAFNLQAQGRKREAMFRFVHQSIQNPQEGGKTIKRCLDLQWKSLLKKININT